jgi:hypothetical protein
MPGFIANVWEIQPFPGKISLFPGYRYIQISFYPGYTVVSIGSPQRCTKVNIHVAMPNGALGNKKMRIRTGAFHECNLPMISELVYGSHPPPKMASQASDVNVRVPDTCHCVGVDDGFGV